MKNRIYLSIVVCLLLSDFSFANNKTKEIKKYDELIEFNADKKDLNYLFENSDMKFPLDDYIYKGGLKKPHQNVGEIFRQENKSEKSLDEYAKEAEAKLREQIQKELLAKSGNRKGNIMLDSNGNVILDCNNNPMYENIMYDSKNCPLTDKDGNPMYKDLLYDENGNLILDENGNPILKNDPVKGRVLLDKNGNPLLDCKGNPMYENVFYDKEKCPILDENGNPLLKDDPVKGKILLDENGNPLLDAEGNPKYENIMYDKDNKPIRDKNGNVLIKDEKGNLLLDKNGKPLLDKEGNPMYENVLYDKDGKPIRDKNGNLILKEDSVKGKILLDENGNPLLDCKGQPMYENILYDSANCPVLDENGNLVTKDNPRADELLKKANIARDPDKYIQEEVKKALASQSTPQNTNQVYGNGHLSGGGASYMAGRHINSIIRDSILADRGTTPTAFSNPDSRYGASSFSNQKNVDEATNEHKLYRTIRAGKMIPAILTTAISSDIEGMVSAQVEQDIYASMGRAVLIPRGSKVIGTYKNDNKIGQDRLAISWREIITPQGVNILLTNAITADNMGMTGAKGSVNNKYLERYGIGYGLSTVSNVLLLALSAQAGNNVYTNQIYEQSNSDVSTIVQDIIEQQKELQPTIEIKQGSRIYIVPSAHIWFPIPKNGEVMAEYFMD
ncbi:DNA type IV secretion system protein ComB10 [uncultured Campylobacter sp.]|uniref:DNA type IV secretion system protein ComB10 n=1 Tax=uncultured Campylobacter sp. TaxID=218934 RepID=UPI002619BB98|nr:DNA type IV secretion system protein ComB10 [uncultured Campylobacter sp.]